VERSIEPWPRPRVGLDPGPESSCRAELSARSQNRSFRREKRPRTGRPKALEPPATKLRPASAGPCFAPFSSRSRLISTSCWFAGPPVFAFPRRTDYENSAGKLFPRYPRFHHSQQVYIDPTSSMTEWSVRGEEERRGRSVPRAGASILFFGAPRPSRPAMRSDERDRLPFRLAKQGSGGPVPQEREQRETTDHSRLVRRRPQGPARHRPWIDCASAP